MGYDGLSSFASLIGTQQNITVIDQMHAFYLRILFRHIRDIWGMDVTFPDGNGISGPVYKNEPDAQSMAKATVIFQSGGRVELERLSSDSLKYLCYKAGLNYLGRRNKLIDSLMQHVSSLLQLLSDRKLTISYRKTEQQRATDSAMHISSQNPSINVTPTDSSSLNTTALSTSRSQPVIDSAYEPIADSSPSLSTGHIQSTASNSPQALTSFTTKDDRDLVYQEHMYEHGSNSAINLSERLLSWLCVLIDLKERNLIYATVEACLWPTNLLPK